MSVADAGHSPAVINTNNDAKLLKYRYTLTSRYQDSSNDWLIGFQAKDKAMTLKEVMEPRIPSSQVSNYGTILSLIWNKL